MYTKMSIKEGVTDNLKLKFLFHYYIISLNHSMNTVQCPTKAQISASLLNSKLCIAMAMTMISIQEECIQYCMNFNIYVTMFGPDVDASPVKVKL